MIYLFSLDNIFILTQSIQRDRRLPDEDVESQIGRIVGRVGPAMLLTSVSESIAFFLGALTPMPAVRLFSLYAAMSVLIDFLLQITVFVTFITLDHKRTLENRIDVCCCLQVPRDKTVSRENRRFRLPRFSWFGHNMINENNTANSNNILPNTQSPLQTPLTSTKSDDPHTDILRQKSKIEPCEEHLMET